MYAFNINWQKIRKSKILAFHVKNYIYDLLDLVNSIKQNIYQLCAYFTNLYSFLYETIV